MPATRDHLPAPRRRFGQNFLADDRVARRLVELFAPHDDDRIVEIGPGRGALTKLLARSGKRFVALEIDPRMIPHVEPLVAGHAHAEVRRADALAVDWQKLAAELGGPLRVIGNLPYNVGTAILRRLVASDAVLDCQVVLQAEVAERLLSPPARKSFGPISIVTQLRCDVRRVAKLSPGVFRPRPKVQSAALQLRLRPASPLPSDEIECLESWLHRGFAHRRKTLAGNLSNHRQLVKHFLSECGLPEDARAEIIPPLRWLELARRLERYEAGA